MISINKLLEEVKKNFGYVGNRYRDYIKKNGIGILTYLPNDNDNEFTYSLNKGLGFIPKKDFSTIKEIYPIEIYNKMNEYMDNYINEDVIILISVFDPSDMNKTIYKLFRMKFICSAFLIN
jgi:hypothetical protein